MNILITSESSCDIPAPLLCQHGIHTVAFSVNFPNRTVADNSIPVEDIFDFFNRTRTIPKTSAVNPDQYTAFWDGLRSSLTRSYCMLVILPPVRVPSRMRALAGRTAKRPKESG